MTNILYRFIVFVKIIGQLLFLYGLLGWAYGVAVQLLHPNWLSLPISHLTPSLRLDTFTIIAFIISAAGFFMWRLAKELKAPTS